MIFTVCFPLKSNSINKSQSNSNPLYFQLNEIIAFNNIQVGDIEEATIQRLKDAEILLSTLMDISVEERTFENTLLILDNLYNSIYKIWNIIELLGSTHPSFKIQEEALDIR